ncbi:MAG TPA: hypothetical protein VK752_24620 [Bryobacteraceae bacterium]|jgi:hypothetical protein|nr:hypothetical protein [Bryobacteraceae bacterium]
MRFYLAFGLLGASLFAANEPDRIDVIAHIPLSGSPVVNLTTGTHWRRNYLYLGRGRGEPIRVLDVTRPTAPTDAGKLDLQSQGANSDLRAAVGTAVVVASGETEKAPRTVTILSLANAEHPKIVREFSGVTSMLKDDARGLIYLTNPDGLWVLRLDPATDVELEKEFEHYVRYNP